MLSQSSFIFLFEMLNPFVSKLDPNFGGSLISSDYCVSEAQPGRNPGNNPARMCVVVSNGNPVNPVTCLLGLRLTLC